MGTLRYLTAGESHGEALAGILEGIPAGLPLLAQHVDAQLQRRQRGHGRSARQQVEQDVARILSGVRHGLTMGSPIVLLIENQVAPDWREDMSVAPGASAKRPLSVPRPGHADLAGALKYGFTEDLRPVLERASARETAMRVALGAIARRLLAEVGVEIASFVVSIGGVEAEPPSIPHAAADLIALRDRADASPVRCLDAVAASAMIAAIDSARDDRDSVGGVVEVVACGVPAGLGSHVHWDRKLDARLAASLMSVQAIKGVEVGDGFASARRRGSEAHDEIGHDGRRFTRSTNRAGGIEGGMSNGQPLRLRLAKKPISTLMRPLASVHMVTKQPAPAHVERADTCAVPALGIVAEACVALVIADALLECFGGDNLDELQARVVARRARG